MISRMSERDCYHLLVYGKVQKVGFRKWTLQKAATLGIQGWVRNRPDGRVEAMATCTEDQLKLFCRALEEGPANARVARLDVKEARPKSFRMFTEKADGPSTAEKVNDLVDELHPEYVEACQRAYDTLPANCREFTKYESKPARWRFGQIDAAAKKFGVELTYLGPKSPPNFLCKTDRNLFGMDVTRPSWVSPITEEFSNNKFLTKTVLSAQGISVPYGEVCNDLTQAHDAFDKLRGDAVVKPVFGTEAKGVTTNIKSRHELKKAFEYAKSVSRNGPVIVEEYVKGVDIRILLIGDKIVAAYLRLPAHVVGDGNRTISELVEIKNAARATLPATQDAHLLELKISQRRLLTLQGLQPDDVPQRDKLVLLGVSPNFTDGADLVPITNQIHPDITQMAQDAARAVDPTAFWGIDVLSEDFAAPLTEKNASICEMNSRPVGGVFRHATHGSHVPFFENLFDQTPNIGNQSIPCTEKEVSVSYAPEINDAFDKQVADAIMASSAGTKFLTPKILVKQRPAAADFYSLQQNSSTVRSALAPWRWLALRDALDANGVSVVSQSRLNHSEIAQHDCASPIGRAFTLKRRHKMKTHWVEDSNRLRSLRKIYSDWEIIFQPFETASSLEVAIVGGAAIAAAQLEYQSVRATGEESTLEQLERTLFFRRGSISLSQRQSRKELLAPDDVLPRGTFLPQPRTFARMLSVINTDVKLTEGLKSACDEILRILPGLQTATVVFRETETGDWGVSEIRPDIDPRPFLLPDIGEPKNLACIQAGLVLKRCQTYPIQLESLQIH